MVKSKEEARVNNLKAAEEAWVQADEKVAKAIAEGGEKTEEGEMYWRGQGHS